MKDIPKVDGTQSIYELVVEQVTSLCQRLMQIPMTLSIHGTNMSTKITAASPGYNNDESDDTDTDNSDEVTNGSKPVTRPRANSDTKVEIRYSSYSRGLRNGLSGGKSKARGNRNEKEYRSSPALSSPLDEYKAYLERFSEIGYIPNDSESSEGSLTSDSPGPLRGYPLSVQRRPSSAGRAERHSYSRDRSSSLPQLNTAVRRCRTPTPTSNGNSFTVTDIHTSNRYKPSNVLPASSKTFGRRERLVTDFQRISPLDKQFSSRERTGRRKASPVAPLLLNKDEILTSYERSVQNLTKRQTNVQSPSETQSKHSSSDGSESSITQQQIKLRSPESESEITLSASFATHTDDDKNNEDKSSNTNKESTACVEHSRVTEHDNMAHHRMTPKRLLPKVPAGHNSNQAKGSILKRDTATSISPHQEISDNLQNTAVPSKSSKTMPTAIKLQHITRHEPRVNNDSKGDRVSQTSVADKFNSDNTVVEAHNTSNKESTESKIKQDAPDRHDTDRRNDECSQENQLPSLQNKDFDIEEIKFKENVRTARREIIDKLRSKYALPRLEQESVADNKGVDVLKENSVTSTTNEDKSDYSNQLLVDKCQNIFENVLKIEHFVKHVPVEASIERHSPVMSIAGLKRYKSTSNLSNLESFDKATSKFDDKQSNNRNGKFNESDKYTGYDNTSVEERVPGVEYHQSDKSEHADTTEKLSKSLTFENHGKASPHTPLDRQGLLRSASVENVDSYQFIDNLSTSDHLSLSLDNALKESGISTLSLTGLTLNNTGEHLTEAELNRHSECVSSNETNKHTTSSSDNGFDSGEGVGNSEDSLDDLDHDQVLKTVEPDTKKPAVSPKLYPAKLILIDEPKDKSIATNSIILVRKLDDVQQLSDKAQDNRTRSRDLVKSSTVLSAVEKLESTFSSRSRPEKRTLKQFKENSKDRKANVRSRSASASRNPASVYGDNSPMSPKALFPRKRFGSATETTDNKTHNPPMMFSVKKSRSIEADLNKICQEETAESIRREWIQRRSASASRKPVAKVTTTHVSTIFEYDKSHLLPSRYLRRRVSGIVSLQNGKFVVVDELQMSLCLLNSEFRIVSEINLENIPCGICPTGSSSFSVGFPYKNVVRVFYVVKDRVTHTRDIAVRCSEWITDICHRKGRLHVLCKGGHVHILGITGRDEGTITVGLVGKLLLNEAGNRFYIHGEGKITRLNDKGEIIWTKSDINASCILLYNDKLYIADTDKKRLMTMSEIGDTRDLINSDSESISAACLAHGADKLFICQYSDELDDESTRRVIIYRKRAK